MKYLKKYKIPFSGLSTGKHRLEFDIDDRFFACYDHSLVKQGQLNAIVDIQKQENMLVVDFDIQGQVKLTCDVCLREFEAPTTVNERVLVKFTHDEWDQGSDEIVVLSHHDYELDIANLLYEYINVSVPHYPKCSEQGIHNSCDPDMLQKLADESSTETNTEEEHVDPRWEALKKIKNN